MNKILNGFNGKTYLGALGLFIAAYLKYDAGDLSGALELGAAGLTAVGIGHKIEKASGEAEG